VRDLHKHEGPGPFVISRAYAETCLGNPRQPQRSKGLPELGRVNGLAWTSSLGTVLPFEAQATPGAGRFACTGNLQKVIRESCNVARSVVYQVFQDHPVFYERFNQRFKTEEVPGQNPFKKVDIHLNAPDGSSPKDGPSAGNAIALSLLSALTGLPAHGHVFMTGALQLTGREALRIGGLDKKIMAALDMEFSDPGAPAKKLILIPESNRREFDELPEEIQKHPAIEVHFIQSFDDVIRLALVDGEKYLGAIPASS
jgi:ATP-dependent Lon protease